MAAVEARVCPRASKRAGWQLALRYSTIGTLRDLRSGTGHADKNAHNTIRLVGRLRGPPRHGRSSHRRDSQSRRTSAGLAAACARGRGEPIETDKPGRVNKYAGSRRDFVTSHPLASRIPYTARLYYRARASDASCRSSERVGMYVRCSPLANHAHSRSRIARGSAPAAPEEGRVYARESGVAVDIEQQCRARDGGRDYVRCLWPGAIAHAGHVREPRSRFVASDRLVTTRFHRRARRDGDVRQ